MHTLETVLVVEDTEDDVFFLKRALKEANIRHPLQVVTDGQQALDYLEGKGPFADRERYPIPFLVLLDLKLPFVMGLDVLRWIRERSGFEKMLVVVLSSSSEDNDMKEVQRLGGNYYLIKPPSQFKLTELIVAMENIWPFENPPKR